MSYIFLLFGAVNLAETSTVITAYLSKYLAEKLKNISKRERRSVSAQLTTIVEEYFKNLKTEAQDGKTE